LYFIGIVGCMGDKTDCCPFEVSSSTEIVTATVTATAANELGFPAAASSSQVTLSRCPEDYVTVLSVCCPS